VAGSRGYVYYEESSAKEGGVMMGRGGQVEDTEVRWSSSLHVEPVYRGRKTVFFMNEISLLACE